jgi:Mg-chelatase subunit ChlD
LVAAAVCTAVAIPVASGNKAKVKPAAVVLVLDRSGSMSGSRIEAAREAASATRAALPYGSEIAVVAFDSDARVAVTLRDVSDEAEIQKGIDTITPGGGTDLYPALDLAHAILTHTQLSSKHVIVLSDGMSPYDRVEDIARTIRKDGMTISTVAIGDADTRLLGSIADIGHGRMYATADVSAIRKIFAKEIDTITKP